MGLTLDPHHLGASEAEWARSGRIGAMALLPPLDRGRVVVVAPHPDD